MKIEKTYEELAKLKAQLTAQSEQENGNKDDGAHFTKHYHNVKKWSAALWIIWAVFYTISFIQRMNDIKFDTWTFILPVLAWIGFVWVAVDQIYLFCYSHYAIDRDDFVSYNVFQKEEIRIPINSIRYIELLNVSKHNSRNARFVYNKFDDFYLNSNKNIEILSDLLRINPDIEIRREM